MNTRKLNWLSWILAVISLMPSIFDLIQLRSETALAQKLILVNVIVMVVVVLILTFLLIHPNTPLWNCVVSALMIVSIVTIVFQSDFTVKMNLFIIAGIFLLLIFTVILVIGYSNHKKRQ